MYFGFVPIGVFVLTCLLGTQVALIEAVNTNENHTCWSIGEANIKPFSVANIAFVSFNGNEGYYTLIDNSKLAIIVGFKILNGVPINCAFYATNKEKSTTVFLDQCTFSVQPATVLTGYSSSGSSVATDCSYKIASLNVTVDTEWSSRVPAQTNSLSAGFKCASIVPSPFLSSIAIRTTLSSSDDDMIIIVETSNQYYMQKIYIYNANVPTATTTGLCTLSDVPRTPTALESYVSSFPDTNGTLGTPTGSEASVPRMNAISMCRSVFMNTTNWTMLGTVSAPVLKQIAMACVNDYQENGDDTVLRNLYAPFFIDELIHKTFNDSFYNGDAFSDLGYAFFDELCGRYCPTVYNFTCSNDPNCEGTLCDSPVICVSNTGFLYDTKRRPILITGPPEGAKSSTAIPTTTPLA